MYVEIKTFLLCPYFKGSSLGAVCSAAGYLIKDIEDTNIKVCMKGRYEACFIYSIKLKREVANKEPVVGASLSDSRPHATSSL